MEKPNIRKKKKKITTCSLSSFSGPLYGAIFLGGFLEVFAALSVQECQLLILLCFFIFLMFGRNFTLTNINWQSFHPCTFTLMSSLSYWLWLLGHQRKRRGNHLYHPPLQVSGTPLYRCFFWYADVLVPHLYRFDSCSLKLRYLYGIDNCFFWK